MTKNTIITENIINIYEVDENIEELSNWLDEQKITCIDLFIKYNTKEIFWVDTFPVISTTLYRLEIGNIIVNNKGTPIKDYEDREFVILSSLANFKERYKVKDND